MTPRHFLAILALTGPACLPAQQNQLDFNLSLFSVMAAINASGYDAEIQSTSNHPLRLELRKHLAAKNIPIVAELKRFYRDHKQETDAQTLSQYVSFALCVDGPPSFKYRFRGTTCLPK